VKKISIILEGHSELVSFSSVLYYKSYGLFDTGIIAYGSTPMSLARTCERTIINVVNSMDNHMTVEVEKTGRAIYGYYVLSMDCGPGRRYADYYEYIIRTDYGVSEEDCVFLLI